MPPKKQEEENSQPYIPFYVLPIFLSDSQNIDAQKILRNKQINIKKCIDKKKIIEILKEKGLAQYLNSESQIRTQGRKFICQNIKTVLQDFISEITKPVDPKKDAGKKDSKKDSKKEQVVVDANKEPILQLNFQKKCNDFHIYFDFPKSVQELRNSLQNGLKIDALVIIQEKTKKGSNLPNYDLLGKFYEQNDLLDKLTGTKIEQSRKLSDSSLEISNLKQKKHMIKEINKIKSSNRSFSNLLVISIPFEKDIAHPQNDELNFINSFFGKLCEISQEKVNYENWLKSSVNQTPMIEPLKEVITKQVPIETHDKKGKKDANKQVQYTTVEQVIETKYESIPQNIKSRLEGYNKLQAAQRQSPKKQLGVSEILWSCLKGIELQSKNANESSSPQVNPEKAVENFLSKPFIKTNLISSLKNNLRKVEHFGKQDLPYNLIHSSVEINQEVLLSEILHGEKQKKESLQFQFIIKAFTEFIKEQQPRIKMDFSNRLYRQKLSTKQVLSTIQYELLKDPKIYEGILKKDNIKLLCLARINPPGRVLYLNNIFESKSVPNFQNWFKDFKGKSNLANPQQFFDYKFQDTGNLSIRKEIYTPTDNATICDEKVTIGNEENKVINISKLKTVYGIRAFESNKYEFWLSNSKDNININIFQNEHQFKKIAKILEKTQIEGSEQFQSTQKIIQSVELQKRVQLWIRTENFIVSHTPYPSIMWLNSNHRAHNCQIRREFGPKGEITTYQGDGTVKILYLNGNTSTFRNNKWEKVVNDQLFMSNIPNKTLSSKIFTEGDKTIKIRQDQTIFVSFSNGNTSTIFSDGTKILFKKKDNVYEIQSYHPYLQEEIFVRIVMPRSYDFNVIGHGSAFAYLGFKNILERSYDGFLYEVWHNKFSSHLYNEKYEFEHKFYEQETRLVHLRDGSLIKIQGQQHIIFVPGDNEKSQEKLRNVWNQAFTIEEGHQQGVYDVYLTQGTIKTKDAESNQFKVKGKLNKKMIQTLLYLSRLMRRTKRPMSSEMVFMCLNKTFSFLLQRILYLQEYFPSIATQTNVTLFLQEDYEYLSEEQIRQMSLTSLGYREVENVLPNKTIKQYTKQRKHQKFFDDGKIITPFSQPPTSKDFEIPLSLVPKTNIINLDVQNNEIEFRILEKIEWDRQFNNVKSYETKIKEKKELRETQMKTFSISS